MKRSNPNLRRSPAVHDGEKSPRILVSGPFGGVEFVALRVLVGVVVADERQVLKGAQVERVLPARGVGLGVGHTSENDVLDEAGFDVGVLEDEVLGYPLRVGTPVNIIKPPHESVDQRNISQQSIDSWCDGRQ